MVQWVTGQQVPGRNNNRFESWEAKQAVQEGMRAEARMDDGEITDFSRRRNTNAEFILLSPRRSEAMRSGQRIQDWGRKLKTTRFDVKPSLPFLEDEWETWMKQYIPRSIFRKRNTIKETNNRMEATSVHHKVSTLRPDVEKTKDYDRTTEMTQSRKAIQSSVLPGKLFGFDSSAGKLKRRRLEAPAEFRSNTKAILKVRVKEREGEAGDEEVKYSKRSRKKSFQKPQRAGIDQAADAVSVRLPNIVRRKEGGRVLLKKKVLVRTSPSKKDGSNEESTIPSKVTTKKHESKKIQRRRLRKLNFLEIKDEESILKTEQGQDLLEQVSRALWQAYRQAEDTVKEDPFYASGGQYM